jgi:hypothetical protein
MVKIHNPGICKLGPEQGIAAVIDRRVIRAWPGDTSNDATIPYSTVVFVCIRYDELVKARPGDAVAGREKELLEGLLSSADIRIGQNREMQLTTVDLSKRPFCEHLDASEVLEFLASENQKPFITAC